VEQRIECCTIDGCGADIANTGMCVTHYMRLKRFGDCRYGGPLPGKVGVCAVDGCCRPCRTRKSAVCNVHYHRLWRTGKPEQIPKSVIEHSQGYLVDRAPGHVLSTVGNPNYVYQHRRVFFEVHGQGPFICHVCAAPLTWAEMHIDHLDDNPTNNLVENLAPACPGCNQRRGLVKMTATKRSQGRLLTLNGETRCLTEWARSLSISAQSLRHRIATGWPLGKALTERGRQGKRPRRGGE